MKQNKTKQKTAPKSQSVGWSCNLPKAQLGDLLPSSHGFGSLQLLAGGQYAALSFSLTALHAALSSLAHDPFYREAHNMAADFFKRRKKKGWLKKLKA